MILAEVVIKRWVIKITKEILHLPSTAKPAGYSGIQAVYRNHVSMYTSFPSNAKI